MLLLTVWIIYLNILYVFTEQTNSLSSLKLSRLVQKNRNGNGLVIKSGEDVVGMVNSVWDDVVAKHQDGLFDPKAKGVISTKLTAREALYHYQASREGIVDSARFLITFGVASSLSESSSLLLHAICNNDVTQVENLLEEGLDVEDGEDESFHSSPLHYAVAFENRSEIIRVLLKNGANVEARARHGATPLMIAASLNMVDSINILVKQGHADVNAAHFFAKTTALHFAAEMGHTEAISLLCKLGANVNLRTSSGGTPIHTASDSNRPQVLKVLVEECLGDVNSLLNGDTTPLYLAAQRGFKETVEELIKLGANLNFVMPREPVFVSLEKQKNKNLVPINQPEYQFYDHTNKNSEMGNGATALHAACENGHYGVVDALLKAGSAQLPSMEGATPLLIALQYHHQDIALRLLKEPQPNVNARANRDGSFSLFAASGAGYEAVVLELIKRNDIQVNLKTYSNATALSHSIYRGQFRIIEILLTQTKHRLTIDEMSLKTALSVLGEKGSGNFPIELIRILISKFKGNLNEVFRHFVLLNIQNYEILTLFVKKGVDPLAIDNESHGQNALHVASHHGNFFILSFFKLLLKENILSKPVNSQSYAISMLYFASAEGHVKVVDILLKEGHVDVNMGLISASKGYKVSNITPLFVASEKGHLDVVKLLIEHSADPNEVVNLNGQTYLPIEIAAKNGFTKVVQYLLHKQSVQLKAESISRIIQLSTDENMLSLLPEDIISDIEKTKLVVALLIGQQVNPTQKTHSYVLSALKRLLSPSLPWERITLDNPHAIPFSPLHAAITTYLEDERNGEAKALDFVSILLSCQNRILNKGIFEYRTKKSQMTPLALALEAQRFEIARYFLANRNLHTSKVLLMKNFAGESPRDVILRLRDPSLIKLLGEVTSDLDDEL